MSTLIAITGAHGFVGRQTLIRAAQRGLPAVPLLRSLPAGGVEVGGCAPRRLGELGTDAVDPAVLDGCGAVIHAAARAHRMGEAGAAALAAYRRCNVEGTRALITAMAAAGVRRLVYVSSIKALGERSHGGPLRPGDDRRPEDPYGVSKAEAEAEVLEAHRTGTIEAVIIRPVLVHGPGARGNLERLMAAIARGRPLPLGAVRNRRSLLGVANLADALLTAATAARVDGSIHHLADDGAISTRRLVEVLAEGLGVQPRLLPVPRWLAVGGATLLGKGAMARRLFDDLEVDDSDFRRDFGWKPRIGLEEGLRAMARDFAARAGSRAG